jgi:two-component system sensor histidine kinase AlgZ
VSRSVPDAAPRSRSLDSRGSAAYWPLQLIGWGAHFWLQASGEVIFARVPWSRAGTLWCGICLTGLVITHLLRLHARKHRWVALPPGALLARAAVSVIVMGGIAYVVTTSLSDAVYGDPVPPIWQVFYHNLPQRQRLFNVFMFTTSNFLTWVAIYFWITLQRHKYRVELHQAQLTEALRSAQLRVLMSQLNPHFLFNSLNGVRALIADEPAKAQDAVTQLARTLRYTLTWSDEEQVSLRRELEMVHDYLALEALRLAERLNVVREIEPAAADARIPVMLVQTLIENAIKHGIAPLKQGGTLRLTARTENRQLLVTVENPRPLGASQSTPGIGLHNCSERLRLLYGSAASLHLDLSDATRAIASVRLPL